LPRARRSGLLATVLAIPLLYGCGSSASTLNTGVVERAIEASIRSQRHLDSTVTCPSGVARRAGVAFTCRAAVDGWIYPFAVTELDNRGRVRYVGLRHTGRLPASG
jgi:hypothetical protein